MRISLNWLKKYVKIPKEVSDEELIRLIGARLVEVEGVIDETHKYDNIYVVRVESCEKIPETHLTLCQINAGNAGQALSGHASARPVVTGEPRSFSTKGRPLGVASIRETSFSSARLLQRSVVTSERSREGLDPASIQVVCGAPNVHEGMLAVWIAPGAIVPASVHEDAPFVIGKRKMRGYESSGMLAGADELDFGDDHSGIVEIDPEIAKPGDLLAEVFELADLVLEIENKSLTHRPDCFGIVGFAREVAGILGLEFANPILSSAGLEFSSTSYAGRSKRQFKYNFSRDGSLAPVDQRSSAGRRLDTERKRSVCSAPTAVVTGLAPSFSVVTSESPRKMYSELSLNISVEDPEICSRYSAVVMEKHGEMKKKYLTWVDTILSKSGMRPIEPIVDATNYLMLLTGQPLHAFDYDKFVAVGKTQSPEIKVRLAREGEKLALIDEKEIVLHDTDIVICSGDTPVALAGAMGGMTTEVDDSTRKIILESATFSLYNLRKTQMSHGIFTEAITRFTKGQPAYQTLEVALECAAMLADGFEVVGVADEYPHPAKAIVVKITTDEIRALLGADYGDELIEKTLQNVGFELRNRAGSEMEIVVPEWRTDIHIKEDIIEEVGRLLGYDNIVPTLPLHGTAKQNGIWNLKRRVREFMSKGGANELLTYSFVSGRLLERAGQKPDNSYKIVNSISPELQYVRQSIVPSLLEKAYLNEKLPVERFAIFEMNKVYRLEWGMDDEKVPVEKLSLGFVVAERKGTGTAFYKAKKYVAGMLRELHIQAEFVPMKTAGAEGLPFEPKRAAEIYVDGEYVGVVGEFKNSVRNEFKLAPYLAGFELVDLEKIVEMASTKKPQIDLATVKSEDLTVTSADTYAEVLAKVQAEHPGARILPVSIYQGPGQRTRNITLRIETKV